MLCFFTKQINLSYTNLSKILLNIGSREIGLKFETVKTEPFFMDGNYFGKFE